MITVTHDMTLILQLPRHDIRITITHDMTLRLQLPTT